MWLASYPRSGNTLVRVIVHDCFGLFIGSKYDESAGEEVLMRVIGYDDPGAVSRPAAIKTHGYPEDDAPAIYVVRDGRSAIVSNHHFLNEYGLAPASIEALIDGAGHYGTWSDHYRAWNPERRPDTLLLRYEDLTGPDAQVAIDRIGQFLGVRQRQAFTRTFSDLRAADPRFFRAGDNRSNISEMTDEELSRFNQLHGPLMVELGYSAPSEAAAALLGGALGGGAR